LKEKYQTWLAPSKPWTRQEFAVARSLLDNWLELPTTSPEYCQERAFWANKIVDRWIQECILDKRNSHERGSELLDMLHRVLFAWRGVATATSAAMEEPNQAPFPTSNSNNNKRDDNLLDPLEESIHLLNQLEQLYQTRRDARIRPGDKAYSMVLQTMALFPDKLPHICEDAKAWLELCIERRSTADEILPDLMVWNSYLHVLAKASRGHVDAPQQAEQVLEAMINRTPLVVRVGGSKKKIKPRRPDVVSFATVLDAYANSSPRQPDAARKAQTLLERMEKQHRKIKTIPFPNTTCYNICIQAHANTMTTQGGTESAERAQEILDRMIHAQHRDEDTNIRPDRISFLSTMNAWAKCTPTDPQSAERVAFLLEQMQQIYNETGDPDLRPSETCCAVVLDAYSKTQNSGPKVEGLLEAMEQNVWQRHASIEESSRFVKASYLAAIRAWGNTTHDVDAPERAERMLYQMQEHASIEGGRRDLMPCVKTFAATMSAWSNSSREDAPERCLAILRRMQQKNHAKPTNNNSDDDYGSVQPNTFLYNIVISAFAKRGDAEVALSFLDEMKEARGNGNERVRPDAFTYATVINALAQSRGFSRSAAQFASDLLEELVDEYSQYKSQEMQPTTHAFAAAILTWANSGEDDCGEQAENLFQNMMELSSGHSDDSSLAPKPNTNVCNAVLRVWSRSPEGSAPERAEAFLQWMQDQIENGENLNVRPDRTSFNHVMKTWAQSGRAVAVRRIETHLNRMLEESGSNKTDPTSMSPDAYSYNCLLEAMKNSRDAQRGSRCHQLLEQLVERSRNSNQKLWNPQSFHNVFAACTDVQGELASDPPMKQHVVLATFGLLASQSDNSLLISRRTIELLLRAYGSAGGADEDFLFDVFHLCHKKGRGIDTQAILSSLQTTLSGEFLDCARRADQKARLG